MSLSDFNQTTKLRPELSIAHETQSFDYAVLNPKVRLLVEKRTSELKSLMRRSVQDIVDIGKKLIEVKEQLGHGNFRAWLKIEFDWSVRTAARFMQVATQFKSANLAHLNIAVSALYLLAEPSASEKAREEALELAQEGENITYAKAKSIVNHYQKQASSHAFNSATTKSTKESNLSTPFTPCQYEQTHSQLEPKAEAKPEATEISETTPIVESTEKLEQKHVKKVEIVEDVEVEAELQLEPSNHIRVLSVKHQIPEKVVNTDQTFDLTFAGVRIDFEGYPKALIILFEQMQNNPEFTNEILHKARLLAVNKLVF